MAKLHESEPKRISPILWKVVFCSFDGTASERYHLQRRCTLCCVLEVDTAITHSHGVLKHCKCDNIYNLFFH